MTDCPHGPGAHYLGDAGDTDAMPHSEHREKQSTADLVVIDHAQGEIRIDGVPYPYLVEEQGPEVGPSFQGETLVVIPTMIMAKQVITYGGENRPRMGCDDIGTTLTKLSDLVSTLVYGDGCRDSADEAGDAQAEGFEPWDAARQNAIEKANEQATATFGPALAHAVSLALTLAKALEKAQEPRTPTYNIRSRETNETIAGLHDVVRRAPESRRL